jgi:hypothetical protein
MYRGLPVTDRALYLKQQIHIVATKLDEDRQEAFTAFGFNEKRLKPRLIQNALTSASAPPYHNALSGLIYLNEYYGIHVNLVIRGIIYETTPKAYPKVYLDVQPGRYRIMTDTEVRVLTGPSSADAPRDIFKSESDLTDTCLTLDVKGYIYRTSLKPLGSYKATELKELCTERGVPVTHMGKTKVKSVLYEDLYLDLVRSA